MKLVPLTANLEKNTQQTKQKISPKLERLTAIAKTVTDVNHTCNINYMYFHWLPYTIFHKNNISLIISYLLVIRLQGNVLIL